jgi:hypothetical protein
MNDLNAILFFSRAAIDVVGEPSPGNPHLNPLPKGEEAKRVRVRAWGDV